MITYFYKNTHAYAPMKNRVELIFKIYEVCHQKCLTVNEGVVSSTERIIGCKWISFITSNLTS
jgi:hypothetical protein